MKKLLLIFSCFTLISCGTSNSENQNTALSTVPSFFDLNANIFTDIGLDQNSNSNILMVRNENENFGPISSNINASLPPINTALLIPHEVAFDCKPLSIYETMSFYPAFKEQFENLSRYSTTDIAMMIKDMPDIQSTIGEEVSQKENTNNITSSCLAQDNSLFVIVVEGEKGGYGFKIARFLTEQKRLEVASREDERYGHVWPYTPTAFGRRQGSTLELHVTGSSQSIVQSFDIAYDYTTNNVLLTKYCSTTNGKKVCGPYPYTKE